MFFATLLPVLQFLRFECDISRLRVKVVSSYFLFDLIKDDIKSLEANEFELEPPVTLATQQDDLLVAPGY